MGTTASSMPTSTPAPPTPFITFRPITPSVPTATPAPGTLGNISSMYVPPHPSTNTQQVTSTNNFWFILIIIIIILIVLYFLLHR